MGGSGSRRGAACCRGADGRLRQHRPGGVAAARARHARGAGAHHRGDRGRARSRHARKHSARPSSWRRSIRTNYREVLAPLLRPGGFLLNLSVEVSSLGAAASSPQHEVPSIWTRASSPGPVATPIPASARPNARTRPFAPRRWHWPQAGPRHADRRDLPGGQSRTGLAAGQGRRPRAGRDAERSCRTSSPDAEDWARLFRTLGIRTIQIAEHDSQVSRTPKTAGEFVSTWSVDGFLGEGSQPAELGWGTGEGPCRRTAGAPPGMGRASTCCVRASTCACAAGRRPPDRSSAI